METLLLLWENQARAWSVDEIAARIYVAVDAPRRSCRACSVASSFERRAASLCAGAMTRAATDLMPEVAAAYRTHLVPLATYIHSKASPSVREFARAFDLKKDR